MAHLSKWRGLPTEAVNPATRDVDSASIEEIVSWMIQDSASVIEALRNERARLAEAVELLVEALSGGGRVILVGAGTSGRLAVIEAAEMPPTFGVSRQVVQAIMAGGHGAVHRAKEGVEDDERAGATALAALHPSVRDVVIGISASGVTPFVRGALKQAKKARSRTVGMTCVANSELGALVQPTIALSVGPEIIAGSTRLKAGTVTKIALNILTTAAMIRIGKTYGNLMVDVQSNSDKLRDRGRRIVSAITGLDDAEAGRLLRRAKGNVKAAIVMQKTGASLPTALQRLRASRDSVRAAIGEDRPRPGRRR